MTEERSRSIRTYIADLFSPEDDLLKKIRLKAAEEDLPDIHVPSNVGKMLYMLTKLQKPRRILEIGTLAGYSTLWMARALPEGGTIITIEGMEKHANIARAHLDESGLGNLVSIIQANAASALRKMIKDAAEPFDQIFLDADKEGYPEYLPLLLQLSRPGTLLLTDNCIPRGVTIGSAPPNDLEGQSIYAYNLALARHPQLESILMTTIVGEKGRIDALGVTIVKHPLPRD